MNRRVLLVTGSTPPDMCGVGDYTRSLALALEKAGVRAEVFLHHRWGITGTFAAIRRLSEAEDALVHIQYPTEGYGYSLGPQLCSLVRPSVATLHEFSLAHSLRKVSLLPFTLRSPYLVMTSEFEKRSLMAKMPWSGRRIRVIPVGSNLPARRVLSEEPKKRIAYFGLIMPRKGLEDLIEFSNLVRKNGLDWETVIIGRILSRHASYAKNLIDRSHPDRVRWILDRGPEEISELLSRTTLGYFPFPDGASERRGSLKAALAAGLPCITTRTGQTPPAMSEAVVFASTPVEAFELALRLVNSPEERRRLSQSALDYARSFSWETIAQAHVQLYRDASSFLDGN
jgi:glycosyltransferase involved in cell wall biosynthesis